MSKENSTLRREAANKQFEYQSALATATSKVEENERKIKSLLDQLSLRDETVNEYSSRIRDLEVRLASQESTFIQEVDSHKKMADVYKHHLQEATDKLEELESSNKYAKETVDAQITQIKDKYKHEFELAHQRFIEEGEASRKRIHELEEQIRSSSSLFATSPYGKGMLVSSIPTEGEEAMIQSSSSPTGVSSKQSPSTADFLTLSTTEMYDRIVAAERLRIVEVNKRREAELYLERILKDVETKAPVIANLKRDYNRVIESHTQLTRRLDELTQENEKLRDTLKDVEKQSRQDNNELILSRQQNTDLSNQIQHILKKYYDVQHGAAPPSSTSFKAIGNNRQSLTPNKVVALVETSDEMTDTPNDIISNFLVTFDDIKELQVRNTQLLQVVRKLSLEQENDMAKLEHEHKVKETHEALNDALKELSNLRGSRQRTEDMVIGLVQQRDMYKAMVEELRHSQDFKSQFSPSKPGAPGTNDGMMMSPTQTQNSDLAFASYATTTPGKRVQDLQYQVHQLEDENRRLKERSTRIEEGEKLLNQSVDQMKSELSTMRLELSKSTSDAKFQRERSDRLEASLSQSQLEVSTTSQRRLDVEREMLETQRTLRLKEESIFQHSLSIKSLEETIGRLQVDLEVTKASESRLMNQLSDQKEELKRQMSLSESIHRIETGLSSRIEEEKTTLLQERDQLSKYLENLRKQMAQKELVDDQRIRTLTDDLKSTQQRLTDKTEQLSLIQQDLTRERVTAQAAQDRATLLEKQLTVVNERLQSIHGSQTLDSILQASLSEKELLLEKAESEILSLNSKLQNAESHAEQFRQISVAAEKTLKELNDNSSNSRRVYEEENQKLQAQVTTLLEDLNSQRNSNSTALQEVEEAREKLRELSNNHAIQLKQLEESSLTAEQVKNNSLYQLASLQNDISKYQEAARLSYANYEHQLQLHAVAEKSFKTLQVEYSQVNQELALTKERNTEISASAIRREKLFEEEKIKLESSCNELKSEMESLRVTNDLLHSQVQSLGVQVEKLSETKATAALSTEQSSTESSAGVLEEVKELQGKSSELREVLRYVKRERDILEAKLSVSETENSRYSSTISSLQRQLDEVKSELKRELDRRTTVRSEDEFTKLMAEVTQLTIVRESNAHLRLENEELSKRVNGLTHDLDRERSENAPLKDSIRILTAEKEALEKNVQSTETSAAYWKDRLHLLVSRYNDVDPEEHRLLKDKFEYLEKEKVELESAKDTLIKEHESVLAAKEKELTDLKGIYERLDRNSNLLRDRLRDFKTKVDDQSRKIIELEKQSTTQKEESARLTAELSEANEKLTVAVTAVAVPTPAPPTTAPPSAATTALFVPPPPATAPPSTATVATTATSTTTTPTPPTTAAPVSSTMDKMQLMRDRLLQKQKEKDVLAAATAAPKEVPVEPSVTEAEFEKEEQVTKRARIVTTPAEPISTVPATTIVPETSGETSQEMSVEAPVEDDSNVSASETVKVALTSHVPEIVPVTEPAVVAVTTAVSTTVKSTFAASATPSLGFSSFATPAAAASAAVTTPSMGSSFSTYKPGLNPFASTFSASATSFFGSTPAISSFTAVSTNAPTIEPEQEIVSSEVFVDESSGMLHEESFDEQKFGESVPSTSSATSSTGPFLALRPPSPGNKDSVPFFGKKADASSVSANSFSNPSTNPFTNPTATSAGFGFAKTTVPTTNPFAGFGTANSTTGVVSTATTTTATTIPKVMTSSIFGTAGSVFTQPSSSTPPAISMTAPSTIEPVTSGGVSSIFGTSFKSQSAEPFVGGTIAPTSTLFAPTKPVMSVFEGSPSYVELSKLNAVQEGDEDEDGENEGNIDSAEGMDSNTASSSAFATSSTAPAVASLKSIGTKVCTCAIYKK